MRKRVGTKIYDTDKSVLVEILPDGIQVFRRAGRSRDFYLYNPAGKTGSEMFFDLSPEDAEKYIVNIPERSQMIYGSNSRVRFSDYDMERIRRLAYSQGLSISKFLLMLVDRYESEQTDRGE